MIARRTELMRGRPSNVHPTSWLRQLATREQPNNAHARSAVFHRLLDEAGFGVAP